MIRWTSEDICFEDEGNLDRFGISCQHLLFVHQLVDMATDFMFGHGIWLWVGRDTEDGEETGTIFVFGIVGCKRKMVT